MMEVIISIFFSVICYFYAKEINERLYPKFKMASPIWYSVGGFLFGLIPMLYLWNKVRIYNKYR